MFFRNILWASFACLILNTSWQKLYKWCNWILNNWQKINDKFISELVVLFNAERHLIIRWFRWIQKLSNWFSIVKIEVFCFWNWFWMSMTFELIMFNVMKKKMRRTKKNNKWNMKWYFEHDKNLNKCTTKRTKEFKSNNKNNFALWTKCEFMKEKNFVFIALIL